MVHHMLIVDTQSAKKGVTTKIQSLNNVNIRVNYQYTLSKNVVQNKKTLLFKSDYKAFIYGGNGFNCEATIFSYQKQVKDMSLSLLITMFASQKKVKFIYGDVQDKTIVFRVFGVLATVVSLCQ